MIPDLFPSFTNRPRWNINPNNNPTTDQYFWAPLTGWNIPTDAGWASFSNQSATNPQYPWYVDTLNEYKKSLLKQGNTTGANAISTLINQYGSDIYPADAITSIYNNYYKDVFEPSNQEYSNILSSVDKDYKDRLWGAFKDIQWNFGPEWVIRKQIEDMYNAQAVAQANRFGWQENLARALAVRQGVDPSQVNVAVNQLWAQQNDETIKLRQSQLWAVENLAKMYADYYNQFVEKYQGSTDKYVVDTAQKLKQLRDSLANAALTTSVQMGQQLFQNGVARRWAGGAAATPQSIVGAALLAGSNPTAPVPYVPPRVPRNLNTWVFNMQGWLY